MITFTFFSHFFHVWEDCGSNHLEEDTNTVTQEWIGKYTAAHWTRNAGRLPGTAVNALQSRCPLERSGIPQGWPQEGHEDQADPQPCHYTWLMTGTQRG